MRAKDNFTPLEIPAGFTPLEISRLPEKKSKFLTGFTIVELLMAIIIISICVIPVALMYQQATQGSYQTRVLTVATALAEEKMEEVLRLGYSGVSDIGLSNFPSPFADYSFQVDVDNVEAEDLDTSVVNETGYKSVEVQVSHSVAPSVTVKSLLTNY